MQPEPETSFQRANRLADEAKARKRREYEHDCAERLEKWKNEKGAPHPIERWFDFDIELKPLLVDLRNASSLRSTREGRVFSHFYMRQRPTEDMAFIRARGEAGLWTIAVIRQQPAVEMRYCLGCKTRHPESEFDWNKKRIPPGLRWYCRSWLRRHEARTYKRAA